MSFFIRILDILFPPRPSELLVRAASRAGSSAFSEFLNPQAFTLHENDLLKMSLTTLLPYRTPLVQACILEGKFHKSRMAHELLGSLLADYIKVLVQSGVLASKIVLVPVPLSKKRRKERGYNQVEEIARCCQRFEMRFEVRNDLLTRTRDTIPQMTLGREARKANMQDAFVACFPLDSGNTYILLDDVVTTGATLLAAYEALQKGGASRIFVLTLAH